MLSSAAFGIFLDRSEPSPTPQHFFVQKICNFVTNVGEKSKTLINKGVPRGFSPLQSCVTNPLQKNQVCNRRKFVTPNFYKISQS